MKKKNLIYLLIILVLVVIVTSSLAFFFIRSNQNSNDINGAYNPNIVASEFSSTVNNPYLTFVPGKKMVYEAETEDGIERNEVYVTNEKKIVNGVETIVVWDRVWLNDELIEDTKDWFAQDKQGNVWYFGEDSKEIIDNKVVSTEGSWEYGINGAQPGIIMFSNPVVGEEYRQEYYKGEAEDMGEIVSVNEQIEVNSKIYTNCVKTKDFTPLEPGVEEYKFYCPEVKGVVMEIEEEEIVNLISIEYNAQPSASQPTQGNLQTKITEKQAEEIALKRVSGEVTDVAIEKKFGKTTYVVEINDNGVETDVIIDIDTGEILGVET